MSNDTDTDDDPRDGVRDSIDEERSDPTDPPEEGGGTVRGESDDAVDDGMVPDSNEGTIEDLGSDVEFDAEVDEEQAAEDLLGGLEITSTADIEVPDRLVDQVIGQDHARDVVKKAAKQRRHVMMIGSPGTGKSML
ncbi:MAG: ATP-binding protein, partial [Haloarculaceae archaeon]